MGCKYSKPEIPIKFFRDFEQKLPECRGKTIVITGTTTGTGYIAALTVARKGAASICLLNRQSIRSSSSLNNLQQLVPGAKFISINCDLSDFSSVNNAISELKRLYGNDGIDILANNAGIMMIKDQATVDGYDVQMQTNHLSHFLLTKGLMPLLEIAASKNGEARVVNHTSEARKGKPFDPKYCRQNGGKLGGDGVSMKIERYHQTKLANALFTYALSAKLVAKGSKVKALCAHPGLAATNLQVTTGQDAGPGCLSCVLSLLFSAGQPQSAEDGTMGLLKCMIDQEVESGVLYGPNGSSQTTGWMSGLAVKIVPDVPEARDEQAMQDLWTVSEEAIGASFVI